MKFKKSWHQNMNIAPKQNRTSSDGIVFHSKTELDRYELLKLMARAGLIKNLQLQVKYNLFIERDGERHDIIIGKSRAVYTPDFVYQDENGNEIIEDTKGFQDSFSKFRIAVFEAVYQKKVKIIKKQGKQWITL